MSTNSKPFDPGHPPGGRWPIVQIERKILLVQIGKWAFLSAGVVGGFISFATWFLVPGGIDLDRFVVAGLFASLTINAFLTSGVFFRGSSEQDIHTLASFFRTPPLIISVVFLLAFLLVVVTLPWWARH
jgi:hypothetical protein